MPISRSFYRLFVAVALLTFLTAIDGWTQARRLVPLDHWAYEYIHRLQLRGHLLDLHPTALPYTAGDLAKAVDAMDRRKLDASERRWAEALRGAFGRRGASLGAELQPGVRLSSATRLDPLRPSESEEGGATLEAASVSLYPHLAGRLHFDRGMFVAQAGLRFDVYYRDDPDGLEAANRLITRNEDAYAGIGSRYVSAYVGRFSQHWAPPGETALLVSDNPVGFDQLHLRVGTGRLALRSVVGELDSMTDDGRFTGTAGADSVEVNVRRYLSAHRFDWRPSRHVALSLMESTIYSGRNSGFSLKYLNPLVVHALAVDGRPKNEENNGLLAGMLWAQASAWTLQGQLLLDDVELMRVSGEPPAVALSGSLTFAGFDRATIGAALTAVSVRAYNTHQPEGRYTHLLRGIGAPYNDYLHAAAFATFYFGSGDLDLSLTPRLDALFEGEGDIHMPYPSSADDAEFIFDGTVERLIRPALELRLQHARTWWLQLDAGPAFLANEGHIDGRMRSMLTVTASLTARLSAADRYPSSF